MRKLLVLTGLAGALFAAQPAAADYTPFASNWSFCTNNSLSVCMNFELLRDGVTNNYQLRVTYTSAVGAEDTGVMTAAGMYRQNGTPDLNVDNASVTTSTGASWSIGTGGLPGGGNNIFEVAANADQGVNNGIPVGGWVLISFTSDNLAGYNLAQLHARGHVQSFGPQNCSLKPDSRAEDNVIDGAEAINARCGTTETIPEPITMILLGSGLLGVGGVGYRRRRQGIEA